MTEQQHTTHQGEERREKERQSKIDKGADVSLCVRVPPSLILKVRELSHLSLTIEIERQ
jgi:hypothetical protein